jgi:hypothetical protein
LTTLVSASSSNPASKWLACSGVAKVRTAGICGLLLCIAATDASAEDAGLSVAADGGMPASPPEPSSERCAAELSRVERRKAWLRERYGEQATRGFPDPKAGIPNMIAVFCEAHPTHEECSLGDPPLEFWPDELTWEAQKTFEDRDPHVIALKRAVEACRKRSR